MTAMLCLAPAASFLQGLGRCKSVLPKFRVRVSVRVTVRVRARVKVRGRVSLSRSKCLCYLEGL